MTASHARSHGSRCARSACGCNVWYIHQYTYGNTEEHLSDGFLAELHSYKGSKFRSQVKAHSRQSEEARLSGPPTNTPETRPPAIRGDVQRMPQASCTISHTGAEQVFWHLNRYRRGRRLIPSNSAQGSAAAEPGSGQTLSPTPFHRVDILCAAGRRWSQDTRGTRTHRTGHT